MQTTIQIPTIDPMPVPAPIWLVQGLLLLTFFLHVVAMNFTVGGGVLAFVNGVRGRKNEFAAQLSRDLARKLPVLLSFTITLGIAPLLFVQVFYGQLFYSSSILMASVWLSVIPLLIVAYYGIYYFSLRGEKSRSAGVGALAIAMALLLMIGFIYVNNMTLALTPDRWFSIYRQDASGWNLNLGDRSVPPRYLHMMISAVAIGGLLPVIMGVRKRDTDYGQWMLRHGAMWFIVPTVLNYIIGTWYLMALPRDVRMLFGGGNMLGTALLAMGMVLPLAALFHMMFAGGARKPVLHASLGIGSALLSVAIMIVMRDIARHGYLAPHFKLSQLATTPNWGIIVLFLGTFVAGVATLWWMGAKVMAAHKPESVPAGKVANA